MARPGAPPAEFLHESRFSCRIVWFFVFLIPMIENPKNFLTDLYLRAVHVSTPQHCLPDHISALKDERAHVVGAGKAAGAMARVIENHFDGVLTGTVVTRYGHGVECEQIEVIEASHPLPDEQGLAAACQITDSLSNLDPDALVICLISGGASALMTLPHESISLIEKKSITHQLLFGGANIDEINAVRKHLSAIKGGRMMQMIHPARSLTLCISDVVGDDPSTIGSGPTEPDPTTCLDVIDILKKFNVSVSDGILELLATGALETPKRGDPIFEYAKTKIIARPDSAIKASADLAASAHCEPIVIGDSVTGDCNRVARQQADFIRLRMRENPGHDAFVVLSGGETTVTVTGNGKGGPNTQFALALAIELQQEASVHAIACDTDGIDGTESNAGAIIDPTTLSRAKSEGLDPDLYLADNNSFEFFSRIGDLIVTGPTLTNVNDFRAILVNPTKEA